MNEVLNMLIMFLIIVVVISSMICLGDSIETYTAIISYGDGSSTQLLNSIQSLQQQQLSHTYNTRGTFTITVQVYDNNSGMGSNQLSVTVLDPIPVVTISPRTTIINEGSTFSGQFQFNSQLSSSYTIDINYGDGQSNSISRNNYVSTSSSTTTLPLQHIYNDVGTYTVEVIVTNSIGGFGSSTSTVTVNNVNPTIKFEIPPTLSTINEGSIWIGFYDISDGYAGSLEINNPHTITVSYGDLTSSQSITISNSGSVSGSTDDGISTVGGFNNNANTIRHRFASIGTYVVTLSVIDSDDGIGSTTISISVKNVQPIVTLIPTISTINQGNQWNGQFHFYDHAGTEMEVKTNQHFNNEIFDCSFHVMFCILL